MAANAGGIRAGLAYVEMYLKDNALVRGLDKAARKLGGFGSSVKGVGLALGKVAALGGTVATGGFAYAAKKFADYGSELNDASERTGVGTDALQELGYAARLTGATMEDVEQGIKFMQKNLEAAAGGGKEAKDAFKELNLTAAELEKLAPEDQFALIAERLSAIEPPAKRTAVALQVLGKGGQRLIPMLSGLVAARQEFRDMGLGLSPEDVKRADEFGDNLGRMQDAIKLSVVAVGSGLEPALRNAVEWIVQGVTRLGQWVKANQGAATIALYFAGAIGALGVSLIVLGEVAEGAAAIIGSVGPVVSKALGLILSPWGLIVAGAAAAGAAFLRFTDTGQAISQRAGGLFLGLADTAREAWGGISDAMEAGDLGIALDIALQGARVAWLQFQDFLLGEWDRLKGWMAGLWDSWKTGMSATLDILLPQWRQWVDAVKLGLDDIAGKLGKLVEGLGLFLDQIRQGLGVLAPFGGPAAGPPGINVIPAPGAAAAAEGNVNPAAFANAQGDIKARDKGELRKAQEELKRLSVEAAIAKEQAWWDRFMKQQDRQGDKLAGKVQAAVITGTFNASVAGRLGGGQLALAQRQANAAEAALPKLDQVVDQLIDIGIQVANGGAVFG